LISRDVIIFRCYILIENSIYLRIKRDDENLEEHRKNEKRKEKERKRKKQRIELFREAGSFPRNPGESTDSFNHGNRISKAKSRKNRERQRLIRRGKEGEDTPTR